jgi:hypothetical protein
MSQLHPGWSAGSIELLLRATDDALEADDSSAAAALVMDAFSLAALSSPSDESLLRLIDTASLVVARRASLGMWESVRTLSTAILACDAQHADARLFLAIAERELRSPAGSAFPSVSSTAPIGGGSEKAARDRPRLLTALLGLVGVLFGGLILLLAFAMLISINNSIVDLAESGGSHGTRWWITRIVIGLVAAPFLIWFWTLAVNLVTVPVNVLAMGIGWVLSHVLGHSEPSPQLALRTQRTIDSSKQLFGCFFYLGALWYAILAPLALFVPMIALLLAGAVLLLIWAPAVAVLQVATTGHRR